MSLQKNLDSESTLLKVCKGDCAQELPISSFSLYKKKHNEKIYEYRHSYCVDCVRIVNKRNYQKRKKYYQEKHREYARNNKEAARQRSKKYRLRHNEDICKREREQYQLNKELICERKRNTRERNLEQYRRRDREYMRKRRQEPEFRLRHNVSSTIANTLRQKSGSKRGRSILQHLPYKIEQLKEHLENQFDDWMSWDNYGPYRRGERTWQIDHIKPQFSLRYDSMDHPNFIECWNLGNLRPLESLANLQKGSKK